MEFWRRNNLSKTIRPVSDQIRHGVLEHLHHGPATTPLALKLFNSEMWEHVQEAVSSFASLSDRNNS